MKKTIFCLSILYAFIPFSYSQVSSRYDSRKIIERGVEFYDSSKYESAIAEFKKVNRNDTNYVWAIYELGLSYIANHQDSLAIVACDTGLRQANYLYPNLLLNKANALDNLKRQEEAIKMYAEGIKKYPANNAFYFETGIAKFRQDKYLEAHQYFAKSIKCNPYHPGSHYMMGVLALKQGKLIPAVLSFQYFLLLENSTDRAMGVISELEKIALNELEMKEVTKVEELSDQDDFSEIEALVRSKVAVSKKYKSKIKLNYNINKLLQLVLEKLTYVKSDTGFYMKFYAPIFENLNKKNLYEPFAYYMLSGANIAEVNAWINSHKETSEQFANWFVEYLGTNVSTFEAELNGKQVVARHWYQGGKLQSIGNTGATGNDIEYWNYFYTNGIKKSEGAYDANGKRNGAWKFYNNAGVLQDIETYKSGDLEGVAEEYYANGGLKSKKNYANNMLEGLQTLYYATGGIESTYEFVAGKKNSKETSYYENGKLNIEMQVVQGKYEGEMIEYYSSGHLKEKSFFKESLKNGKRQYFYDYPENTLRIESSFEKGVETGAYKVYYRNGKTEQTGMLNKEGQKDGIWQDFYDNGNLELEDVFSNGKQIGSSKNYNRSGKLIEEYIYKNDFLQEYKAYDLTGKIIYQNKKEGKSNYDVILYHANGNKKREGKVLAGKLTGLWKDYNENGVLVSEMKYTDGKKTGKYKEFFENKTIKEEIEYEENEANGPYSLFYKNGKLKTEGQYIDNNQIGEWKFFYANDNKESVKYYKEGSLEGWQTYYAVNGKLSFEEFYELGYLSRIVVYDSVGRIANDFKLDKGDGEVALKYKNGKTRIKNVYKNGNLEGEYNYYYPNGKVFFTRNYVNGQLHGEDKQFYSTGAVELQQYFIDGKRNGKLSLYFEDGSIKREETFAYGLEEGKSIFYYPNKKVSREYNYENSNLEGRSTLYAETGDLVIDRIFSNDILKSYSYSDANGVLIPSVELKNETGIVKSFYKNGTLALEYTLQNGCLEGKRTEYHPNGKISKEDYYLLDESDGTGKEYFPSGKLKMETRYKNGEKDGKAASYYENGNLKSEETFMNGKLHGLSRFFDPLGKISKMYIYYNDDIIDEK